MLQAPIFLDKTAITHSVLRLLDLCDIPPANGLAYLRCKAASVIHSCKTECFPGFGRIPLKD